jgi:hypothetical protein
VACLVVAGMLRPGTRLMEAIQAVNLSREAGRVAEAESALAAFEQAVHLAGDAGGC